MKWLILVIALWAFLSVDFIISFDALTHMAIHAVIGVVGTYYIYKNRKKFK
jgi:hypothetical protein